MKLAERDLLVPCAGVRCIIPQESWGLCFAKSIQRSRETALRNSAISTGVLHYEASHAGRIRGKDHAYHGKVGNWIRDHRGIYRLGDFPTAERPDLMLWYLWSQNRHEIPEGAFRTALETRLQTVDAIIGKTRQGSAAQIEEVFHPGVCTGRSQSSSVRRRA